MSGAEEKVQLSKMIIESYNHIGWKRPTGSPSPAILPSPTVLAKPRLSTQRPNIPWTPPGSVTPPSPSAAHSSAWPPLPNVQPEPSLVQLEASPSSPITSHMREEADPQLTTTSLQVVKESNEVSPEPPLLQTEQSQLLQPLLVRPVLQTPHQLCCPSLNTGLLEWYYNY